MIFLKLKYFMVFLLFFLGFLWIKFNEDVVCFGVKNDVFGNFIVMFYGIILIMRLVYILGFVMCNNRIVFYGSYWVCKKGLNIVIIVISVVKNVIFLEDYENKFYLLVGYYVNLLELVFLFWFKLLKVINGEEY